MIRFLFAVLVLFAALAPASAQNTAAPASPPPAAISAGPVSDTDDARIAQRIRAIFAQIDSLHPVGVTVRSGVVTLTGTVASPAESERAAAIAERVAGVVTVQNRIDRDLAVE